MSQNSTLTTATSTTSFIISSSESLNRSASLSASQSTGNSENNMTATDSSNQLVMLDASSSNSNNIYRPHQVAPSAFVPQEQLNQQSKNNYSHYNLHNGANVTNHNDNLNQEIYGMYKSNNNNSMQSPTAIDSVVQKPYTPNLNYSQLSLKNNFKAHEHSSISNAIDLNECGANISPNFKCHIEAANLHDSPRSLSFQNNKKLSTINKRTSVSSLESATSNSLMPINVKSMLLHGVASDEIMKAWLTSIKCDDCIDNFLENGYDMALLSRMTPQDLSAIGCKNPALRKKLLVEIKKLNLEDDIPDTRPHSIEKWLELLKLGGYLSRLCGEGYNTIDKVCDLTWEDLEDIGITKLGHQKRLLLGIERIKKFDKQQEDQQQDQGIYDVHPNHRMSLNQNSENRLSTLSRSTLRSGFFQTKSGANLDYRGLPVATVMPALKHMTNSLAGLDISHPVPTEATQRQNSRVPSDSNSNNNDNQLIYSTYNGDQTSNMNDLSNATMKRKPPPLPPMRTNSLKMPELMPIQNNNSIYGNTYGFANGNHANQSLGTMTHIGSTSFLRTPKLGTLTATTNKMLTQGGHIQSVNGQSTIKSAVPVRVAPLPPLPSQPPPVVNQEGLFSNSYHETSSNLPSLISHQLASADEFPPPPPS